MNIQILSDSYSISDYNSSVHHPLQSWEWGEARKETGLEVIRIAEFDKDTLMNAFQMTLHKIPYTPFKLGYIPRSVWPTKETLDFLYDFGQKHNLIFIKLEPDVENPSNFTFQILNLIKSPHPLFPEWTQVLDLTSSEDDLLRNCKSKTRYNIKLAQKKGVVVKEESNDDGFEKFIKLYFETTRRQKYYGHTTEYHKIIWDNLKQNIAHVLIAYYNNEPLAAYELFHFKNRLYYPYGGSSDKYRDVMASNLIMWEAIKLGKRLGAKIFDMWGSLPPDYDRSDSWSGFTRFKEGYGTTFKQFAGSYDLVINPPLYALYNTAHKMRQVYLQMRS